MQQAEKTLSIREEYGAVLQMLEEPSKDTGGVVVTGQHGIGEWSLLFVIIFMTSPPKHCQLREMLRRLSNGKFTAFRYSKSSLSLFFTALITVYDDRVHSIDVFPKTQGQLVHSRIQMTGHNAVRPLQSGF
jgi:hypothetical protein